MKPPNSLLTTRRNFSRLDNILKFQFAHKRLKLCSQCSNTELIKTLTNLRPCPMVAENSTTSC